MFVRSTRQTTCRCIRPHSMPPKSALTSSFSASELDSEVVCPLKTVEGSNCRKRCLGVSAFLYATCATPVHRANGNLAIELQEKRYRSMQEHIRRAHPEHYIAKLPATEESFQLMINTPPSEKPPLIPTQSYGNTGGVAIQSIHSADQDQSTATTEMSKFRTTAPRVQHREAFPNPTRPQQLPL